MPPLVEVLGQQVVVDNRGGAGSVIGTQLMANATPGGCTLGFFDTAFTINAAVTPSLPYDSEKDFESACALSVQAVPGALAAPAERRDAMNELTCLKTAASNRGTP